MHKISFAKFASLVAHVKPNDLVAPLIEHLSFSDSRIEALEQEIAALKEMLVPHGLGGK